MIKTLFALSLIGLSIGNSYATETIIDELKDIPDINSEIDKQFVYLDGDYSGSFCAEPVQDSVGNCLSYAKLKLGQKGTIDSLSPIIKKENNLNFYSVTMDDGNKYYLGMHKGIDVENIYGEYSPIVSYNKYKKAQISPKQPIVEGSDISITSAVFYGKDAHDRDYNKIDQEKEKKIKYSLSNGKDISEDKLETYRSFNQEINKNPEIITLLLDMPVEFNKLSNKFVVYSSISTDSPVIIKLNISKQDINKYIVFNYYDTQWLFVKGLNISTNGKSHEFENMKFDREIRSGGHILENMASPIKDIEMIKDIIKSEDSFIRFYGKEYYNDKKISKKNRQELLNILKVYYLSQKTEILK